MSAGTTARNMYNMKQEMIEEEYGEEGLDDTLSANVGYAVQAHHLICCSTMNDHEAGALAQLARDSDYDINSAHNGIALPAYFGHQRVHDKVRHRGGHWKDYYGKVDTELAKVYKEHKGKKPCGNPEIQEAIRGDLEDTESFIRDRLEEKQDWWLYEWSKNLWAKDYRDEGTGTVLGGRNREGSSAAGLAWLDDFGSSATTVKRRHTLTHGQPVLLSDWYSGYDYPVPGSPTA